MWIAFAFASALFAGATSILAKCGIRKTDSTVATAVRTIVVLLFSWIMTFVSGSALQVGQIDAKTWLFLVLSGLATGASWLYYFKALQLGDINQVVPVDKSSIILTLLLAFFLLREAISLPKAAGIALIGVGTFLMIERKPKKAGAEDQGAAHAEAIMADKGGICAQADAAGSRPAGVSWFFYAAASAVFASLTSILGKIGIAGVESNLGTAIRTGVVLVMAWVMVFAAGKTEEVKKISGKELVFICLSGVATGGSWLCYYKALQDGPASAVVPIDKLSILVTVLFSYLVFHERLSKKAAVGLGFVVVGTFAMLVR